MQEKIGVSILVFDQTKQKILLGKRKNTYKSGYYGLPGGKIELKEPLQQTVKRELKEETNLDAKTVTYLGVVRDFQETYNFIHFVFICTDYQGELTNREPDKCDGWIWCDLKRLPKLIVPGHQAAIHIFENPDRQSLREIF